MQVTRLEFDIDKYKEELDTLRQENSHLQDEMKNMEEKTQELEAIGGCILFSLSLFSFRFSRSHFSRGGANWRHFI